MLDELVRLAVTTPLEAGEGLARMLTVAGACQRVSVRTESNGGGACKEQYSVVSKRGGLLCLFLVLILASEGIILRITEFLRALLIIHQRLLVDHPDVTPLYSLPGAGRSDDNLVRRE